MNISEIAKTLLAAKNDRKPIEPITQANPSFDLALAYDVQETMLEAELARGAQLAGYKMGLTSHAKQRNVGVYEPINGFLLKEMEHHPEQPVSLKSTIHPRVEPEIAVVVQSTIDSSTELSSITEKLSFLGLAIEVLDSRFQDFKFKLPDVVADNTSANGYRLGTQNLLGTDVSLMGIVVRKNGRIVQTGAPAAVLGNPLFSVAKLAEMLARRGRVLEPGMVVLTGGITAAVAIQAGDTLEVECARDSIRIQCES